MIFVVDCKSCGFTRRFSLELGGRRFKCPKCPKGTLKVPKPPTGTIPAVTAGPKPEDKLVECAQCGTVVNGDETRKGSRRICPDCREEREFSESQVEPVDEQELARATQAPKRGDRPAPARSGATTFLAGVLCGAIVGVLLLKALEPEPAPLRIVQAGPVVGAESGTGQEPEAPPTHVVEAPPQQAPPSPPVVLPLEPAAKRDGEKPLPTPGDGPENAAVPKVKKGGRKPAILDEFIKTPTGSYKIANADDFIMDSKIFTVSKVIDGDTMHIQEMPSNGKVRLLGVDTPETKHVMKGIEFGGPEASTYTKKMLEGKKVIVKIDPKHIYGLFGRPLVYLETLEGEDFNLLLIKAGLARVTHEYPFDRMAQYTEVEKVALARGLGMWNKEARKAFDERKKGEVDAEHRARDAERAKEQEEHDKVVREAVRAGGRYIAGKKSTSLHEPWCPRKPKTNTEHIADLAGALEKGYTKHSCFDEPKEEPREGEDD